MNRVTINQQTLTTYPTREHAQMIADEYTREDVVGDVEYRVCPNVGGFFVAMYEIDGGHFVATL